MAPPCSRCPRGGASRVGASRRRDDAMNLRRAALVAFAIVLALLPLAPVPEFWITQANYIGLYTLVVLGLVLLTGIAGLTSFGQAAFVGIGAYTAAYLTLHHGISPWLTVWIGLAFTGAGGARARAGSRCACRATTCRWRRSPGGCRCSTCSATSTALGKYDGLLGIPALNFFGIDAQHRPPFFYLLWTIVVLAADRRDAPARFARRPGAARRQGRRHDGRGDGRRHLSRQGHRLRSRRAARERLGLAVRALPAHRQPVAVRPQHGHRIPVHGGARRRRPCLGRARRRRRRPDPEGPAAGAGCRG